MDVGVRISPQKGSPGAQGGVNKQQMTHRLCPRSVGFAMVCEFLGHDVSRICVL